MLTKFHYELQLRLFLHVVCIICTLAMYIHCTCITKSQPPVVVEKTGDGLESVRTMLERNQRYFYMHTRTPTPPSILPLSPFLLPSLPPFLPPSSLPLSPPSLPFLPPSLPSLPPSLPLYPGVLPLSLYNPAILSKVPFTSPSSSELYCRFLPRSSQLCPVQRHS